MKDFGGCANANGTISRQNTWQHALCSKCGVDLVNVMRNRGHRCVDGTEVQFTKPKDVNQLGCSEKLERLIYAYELFFLFPDALPPAYKFGLVKYPVCKYLKHVPSTCLPPATRSCLLLIHDNLTIYALYENPYHAFASVFDAALPFLLCCNSAFHSSTTDSFNNFWEGRFLKNLLSWMKSRTLYCSCCPTKFSEIKPDVLPCPTQQFKLTCGATGSRAKGANN